MLLYAAAVSLSLFIGWLYVWERLIETATLAEPLRQTVLGFFVIAFGLQATRWLLFRLRGDLSWLVGPAYFLFGLLSHLFIATLAKDFIFHLWWIGFPATYTLDQAWVNAWVSYAIFFICLAANLWGAQTAYEGPEIRRIVLDESGGDAVAETIRIVQISDLHVGPIIKKSYVENVVRKVNALNPDVIVVTGDLGDGRPEFLEGDLQPLEQLRSRWGSFYVTGNHEYYWNVDAWIHAAKSVGLRLLFNSGVLLPVTGRRVWLAGVPDRSAWQIRKDHPHLPEKAIGQAPADAYKILLAHHPKSVNEASVAGFDLVLSGHTHGGQYLPYTWLAGYVNQYAKGLHRHGRSWIYVNAGTGFWGPPLRLGVTSEITLFELRLGGVLKQRPSSLPAAQNR